MTRRTIRNFIGLAAIFVSVFRSVPMRAEFKDAEVGLVKNRAVLDLPIADKKLVLAHNMTEFLHYKGNYDTIFTRRDLYSPDGFSASLGGMLQYKTIQSCLPQYGELDMVEAAAFEMRTALKLGVDGFQFYYPYLPDDGFNRKYTSIIKAHFAAAKKHHLKFKLTLCLSNPRPGKEADKIALWARVVKDIMSETKDSENWLRTPDGRFLFYLYSQDSLSDAVPNPKEAYKTPELIEKVAMAYEKLARACGIDIAYIYCLRHPESEAYVNAVLDYFPAIWDWIDFDPDKTEAGWQKVVRLCRERKRTYTQTVFSDFYGSKLYDVSNNGHRLMFDAADAVAKSVTNVARDCVPTQLSYVFRRLLERAVSTDAALINYATWNDFPEGHHIAPEINHNFGFPVLLKHYKRQWKKEKPETKEAAVVFFKKYAHTIKPKYFDIPVRFLAFPENEAKDDFVDVVCILNHKADLYFKGRKIGPLATGLSSTLIPTEPGPVSIKVVRGKKTILKVTAPEWITAEPYRTDRLTFVYSSQCPKYYRDVFGSSKIPVSDEYALDAQGVPNWKKRYQFWKK